VSYHLRNQGKLDGIFSLQKLWMFLPKNFAIENEQLLIVKLSNLKFFYREMIFVSHMPTKCLGLLFNLISLI